MDKGMMDKKKLTEEEVIELLGLVPLEGEGGMAAETWRSTVMTQGGETAGTAIFYFLRGRAFSHLHRLTGDEMYHFYLGDAVEMLELLPDVCFFRRPGRNECVRIPMFIPCL